MKVAIIQPYYTTDFSRADELFAWEIKMLDECDKSMDIIVLPESSDVPVLASTKQEHDELVERFSNILLNKAKETAIRCNAMVFFNGGYKADGGYRNTTYAINRQGEVVGRYFKQHLTHGEMRVTGLDCEYTKEFSEPYIIEMEGLRFAFLTCYDFYFYEYYPVIARQNVDIIIGCSHQRSDTLSALEIINRFLCYNTNAYLIRSSVSMGENSPVGGGSMVVSPKGDILLNMTSRIGMETVEIDPKEKYYKPAGYGNPSAAHWEYVEKGRRPWKYRAAGSSVVAFDEYMPYPRVCAHRGFNFVAPENSLPAFGSAVGLGAEEIEFDIWFTKDGIPVSIHDWSLERVSNGSGGVTQQTYKELLAYDFGYHHDKPFHGLKILKAEEIFQRFAGRTIMNVHLKTPNDEAEICPYEDEKLWQIIHLIRKYDCARSAYIMTSSRPVRLRIKELAPDIMLCCGAGENPWRIVENAIETKCDKVQFVKYCLKQEMVDKAHEHGLKCNVFWADDPEEAIQYLNMGIDTILTNNYFEIAQVVEKWKKERKCIGNDGEIT